MRRRHVVWGETGRCTRRSCACLLFFSHSMLKQGLGVSLFIFSLANHAVGVPTVITHPGIQSRCIVRSSAGLWDCSKMSGEEDLRGQVEELKKRAGEAEEEKRVADKENKEMRRRRKDLMRGSGAGGLAGRAMSSPMHVGLQGQEGMHVGIQGQQDMQNDDRRFYFSSGHPNTRPPKFPTDPAKVPAWRHRMMLFVNSHGLRYTVKQSTDPVNIISEDETILARRHTQQVMADHERAWTFLLEATVDAPFEETMLAAQTLEQAWHVIVGWGLPTCDAEKALLVRQLETVQMVVGEVPKIYFARVDNS